MSHDILATSTHATNNKFCTLAADDASALAPTADASAAPHPSATPTAGLASAGSDPGDAADSKREHDEEWRPCSPVRCCDPNCSTISQGSVTLAANEES